MTFPTSKKAREGFYFRAAWKASFFIYLNVAVHHTRITRASYVPPLVPFRAYVRSAHERARGLPLSLSRYFIDCGRFPTGGDEWGYDVTGTFFLFAPQPLPTWGWDEQRERERERISGIPCARSFWPFPLALRLLGLFTLPSSFCFSCRSTLGS